MEQKNIPEVITKNARSIAATKRHQRERKANMEKKEETLNGRRLDWHLLMGVLGIIITLGSAIFGCYWSLKRDINDLAKEMIKIETVLILKGVAPPELFASEEK